MAEKLLDNIQVHALLVILINNRPDIVHLPPDGVLSFSHRLVVELVRDCLNKFQRGKLTSENLTDLSQNIRTILQQAEEKSQNGDLAFLKELGHKVLSVLECPTRSLERPETPEGDTEDGQNRNQEIPDPKMGQSDLITEIKCVSQEIPEDDTKDGQNVNPEIPDPNGSQWELKRDLITETTLLSNPDSVICEIPEIQEPAGSEVKSLIPVRKPHMDDFETSKLISSGNFGAVYIAHHKDSRQMFAMKKMTKRSLDTPQRVELAFLERDILTFADCPFVVSMLCSFPTKSHLCMVMEYVGGGDCLSLLYNRGSFSVPLARLYFAEAVLAVEYLHSYGIVHRDLKPDNLLITSTGHIKVTDFGMSKLGVMIPESNTYKELRKDISKELDYEYAGTPYYMAPEILLEKSYGRPVDWWAMGVILYEFLVGNPPFDGDSTSSFFRSIVRGDINWKCNPAAPPDARNIITKLLKKKPADRLGTQGAFQIKEHPFLRDLDFDNLLSQEPEYVPELESDVDTSVFLVHVDEDIHLISDDEEDNESPDFQNFTTSSQKLSKLCTSTTSMNTSPQECSPESTPECLTECLKESIPECLTESTPECFTECLPESTPERFPESTPECSPESTPECSPESTPECSPESTPECSPESTPECSPESTPERFPESTPECSPESTPECSPESTPECSPESTPECFPESTPERFPESTPECSPESTPECSPECSPESTPECFPETTPKCSPESTPECSPECLTENTPECSPESTPECYPENTPECSPENTPECSPESTPECYPENTPECSPENTPECSPENTPECSPESTPECYPENTPECSPENTPECSPESTPEYFPECSKECIPASSTNISEMPKESSPEPDRDDAITSLPSSSPLSEFPAQEERKSETEQEKSEKKEKGKKRRGNIFRRILSSCRRGLSRAARAFSCCGCSSRTI
ncbi:microtubule-associated serine/threonine-protein kinase 4-like isoform 2-T2 [Anomaloglossus baeobatrachus]|uniref:microtubule-associated serine/threonine-protein kinase 4-like n=1 Tax=Anomaloglossus baeobatrachus TaxID=238106 RepID=UPI003F4F79C9